MQNENENENEKKETETEMEYEFFKTDENEFEIKNNNNGISNVNPIIEDNKYNLLSQKFSVTTYESFKMDEENKSP